MWRSKHQAAGQRQDSKRGTEIWVGSKHQKVKNRIYISLFHEDTYRTICKHTETENHRITWKQNSPLLSHNWARQNWLTALSEHGYLCFLETCSSVHCNSRPCVFLFFNAVIKSLLPLPRQGYYKTAPRVSDYKVVLSFFYSFFLYWNSSEISNILFNTKGAFTETPLALRSVILAICSPPPPAVLQTSSGITREEQSPG